MPPLPTPPLRVGLATQTASADLAAIERVAKALDIQVKRDLAPLWGIDASVEALPDPGRVPTGVMPIFVMDHTPNNVGGLHTDDGGRPFAVVLVTRDWALGASHECIEMLIDPLGNRMQEGIGLQVVDGATQDSPDRVHYLVEACDPMEDPAYAYTIDGVVVSDFYTPRYFDDAWKPGIRYSMNGGLTRPRQVQLNGYLSWLHPALGRLQQLRWFDQGPHVFDLPDHTQAMTQDRLSHRQFVDRHTVTPRLLRK